MIKIGITGGIGSGKSTVCKLFQLLGVPVYNSDYEARLITDTHPQVVQKIKETFGEESYVDGKLNRPYISSIVFNNKEELAKLNGIVHPAVAAHFQQWLQEHSAYPYVLKEAAILFESGAYKAVDKVITVSAPRDLRIKRVVQRDGFDVEEIKKRMNNQWSEEEKIKLSDEVIIADDVQLVIPQVVDIHRRYLK